MKVILQKDDKGKILNRVVNYKDRRGINVWNTLDEMKETKDLLELMITEAEDDKWLI